MYLTSNGVKSRNNPRIIRKWMRILRTIHKNELWLPKLMTRSFLINQFAKCRTCWNVYSRPFGRKVNARCQKQQKRSWSTKRLLLDWHHVPHAAILTYSKNRMHRWGSYTCKQRALDTKTKCSRFDKIAVEREMLLYELYLLFSRPGKVIAGEKNLTLTKKISSG